jgi:hypothetical protein
MTDQTPDNESPGARPAEDRQTQENPGVAETLTTQLAGPQWPDDDDVGSRDEEWVSQTTSGIRLGLPLACLCALLFVAGGFWAGAELEKSHTGSGTGSLASLAARFRSGLGTGATGASGAGGSGGLGGFAGLGGSGATIGTISTVDGNTLYVDDTSTGSIVKVTLTKQTTITRNSDAAADDLRPGDTVSVQGATGTSGAVAATSVSATAPGVNSGFAGFPGGGFGGNPSTGTGSTTTKTTTTPSLFGG